MIPITLRGSRQRTTSWAVYDTNEEPPCLHGLCHTYAICIDRSTRPAQVTLTYSTLELSLLEFSLHSERPAGAPERMASSRY